MSESLYREQELREASLEYFQNDILATNVWIKKYALKTKDGYYKELTPDETIRRVTKEIHRIESKHPNPLSFEEIYEILENFKYFIFGGSILFGLGNNNAVSSLGNCFFIDNNSDSYGGICNIDESLVQLMKRRGGVGITMENLRPSTAAVNNSATSSTGAISFVKRYSNTTREVAQDGRRGALMISCHVNHPDITEFVAIKNDKDKITGANISVKITDEFMQAVENDRDYFLSWPTENRQINLEEQIPYNKLIKLPNGTYVKKIKAKNLWNSIIHQAHKNAEPGVLFWDSIIRESPADVYAKFGFTTKGTNPCVTGDTLIKTNKGELSIKEILEKNENIKILTFNETIKELEYKNLEDVFLTKNNANIIEIEIEDGTTLKLTPDHKVYTENRGWIEAAKLNTTDIILKI